MTTFQYTIQDEVGIHARPAGILVKKVKDCSSTVTLEHQGKKADASKLMMLMSLGVKKGDTVTVSVEGDNEEEDAKELQAFFEANL